jgi:hypothetical protein
MSYQALPPAAGLIERARQDAAFGEVLSWVPKFFHDRFDRGRGGPPWPEADALCRELRELTAQHPRLEQRNCFLDSRWDALHYLLSANRRSETAEPRDSILDHAVLGTEIVAEHVQGSQGAPIKYVPPDEVASIASLVGAMSPPDLRKHYDPAKMTDAGVYKFWPDLWDDTERRFAEFRQLYLDAAQHGEAMLVVLD